MKKNGLFIKEIRMKDFDLEADYSSKLDIFKTLNKLSFSKPLTFFVGENGTGKSTLLEAIAINFGFNSEGGSLNYNFSMKETSSNLWRYLKLVKIGKVPEDSFFLRAESFYNMASYVDEVFHDLEEFGGESLHMQSHGESFFNLIKFRFRGKGLYILDEPEAALSPQRQLSLMVLLDELLKSGSQVIIVTHSPILLAMPDASILSFDDHAINEISYEDTSSYQVTKMLIDNKDRLLNQMFFND